MALKMEQDLQKLTKVMVGLPSSDSAPFERPPETIEEGPLYVNIEERMPELATPSEEEVPNGPKLAIDRRDFMRLFSASTVLASTAACIQRPVEKAIPYVNQPVDQLPGVAVNYATLGGGPLANGLIVKTREGRPTKIEGNPEHPLSQGSTNTTDQAALQALYHPERPRSPRARLGKGATFDVSWDGAFEGMAERIAAANGKVAIFTGGLTGSRLSFFKKFLTTVGAKDDAIYTFEPNSLYAETSKAYELAFGEAILPRTDMRRTKLIVGIGSDFHDIGLATTYESKSFAAGHGFRFGRKGRFVQFESRMTTTGASAAERHVIGVGDELAITLCLVEKLIAEPNAKGGKNEHDEIKKILDATADFRKEAKSRLGFKDELFVSLAKDLLKGRSLVMVGSSSSTLGHGTQVQIAGILANILIGAYGNTLHIDRGWIVPPVKAGDLPRFLADAKDIEVLFVVDSNPAFEIPASTGILDALKKIKSVISVQVLPNETDQFAEYLLNHNHFLESWGDAQTVAGFWATQQPTVRTMYNSKQIEDIMMWIAAKMKKPMGYSEYRDYLMASWKTVYALVDAKVDFDTFFKAILRRGFVGKLEKRTVGAIKPLAEHFSAIKAPQEGLKLAVHLDARLMAGAGAALPVLQEVGDPMTTVAWDTWVAINPNTVKKLGLRYNEVVEVQGDAGVLRLAVFPMPGLALDTVAIPRGNGHKGVSKVSEGVGVDPLPILAHAFDRLSGSPVTAGATVKLTTTRTFYRLCAMQKHNDLGNRSDIYKVIPLVTAAKNMRKKKDLDKVPDLYPALEKGDYTWGMSIDLDKCTGCSVCMIACAQENNVAQVGREQILMGREMHWIRLDRYFSGPVNNPTVRIQPVMCQHCNHAPCEAVCPVFATTHDHEGMNAMTYNRCVGTRYCANACPYKVRRFNWFTYKWNIVGDRERDRNIRALNPDVTVRTKGVMEKCSFCVQRIREAKHAAKERGPKARVQDGEIRTACQQACPSDAIEFGNLADERSRVARARSDNRAYLMLGGEPEHEHYGLKTLPNVSYLAQVTYDNSQDNVAEDGPGMELP